MAGETWRGVFQAGKETTPGTGVAATRILYFNLGDSRLSREREARPWRFATGTRDNTRAFTLGPQVVSGTVSQPLSASELIELLLITIKGGVTPTQPDPVGSPTVYLWTFTPGTTLDAMTLEWDDGANVWEANGVHGNRLRIAGSANGQQLVTCELFGRQLVSSTLTGSLTGRTPDFHEGWETKLYVDAFGGTPGTTIVPSWLLNWDINITNNLGRKYFADNTNALGGVTIGELSVEATLTVEADPAQSATEFSNWDGATKRLVRLEFGQNEVIENTYKKFVTIDIPGAWSAFDLGQTDEGTRAYELRLSYVYDPTNAFGVQVRCQNARSAAW